MTAFNNVLQVLVDGQQLVRIQVKKMFFVRCISTPSHETQNTRIKYNTL